jgi:hypothetical protein
VFAHAPLYRNKKLKEMFDTNSKEPEELIIDMMLLLDTVKREGKIL